MPAAAIAKGFSRLTLDPANHLLYALSNSDPPKRADLWVLRAEDLSVYDTHPIPVNYSESRIAIDRLGELAFIGSMGWGADLPAGVLKYERRTRTLTQFAGWNDFIPYHNVVQDLVITPDGRTLVVLTPAFDPNFPGPPHAGPILFVQIHSKQVLAQYTYNGGQGRALRIAPRI